jgi:hypothetical protein
VADAAARRTNPDGWLGSPSRRWVWALYLTLGVGPWLYLLGAALWEHLLFTAFGRATCWTELDVSYVTPLEAGAMIALFYAGPWLAGVLFTCVTLSFLKQPTLRPTAVTLSVAVMVTLILLSMQSLNSQYVEALQRVCNR